MAFMIKGLLISVLIAAAVTAPAAQKNSGDSSRGAQDDAIREATQRGWVPGSDKFRTDVKAVTGGRAVDPPRRPDAGVARAA